MRFFQATLVALLAATTVSAFPMASTQVTHNFLSPIQVSALASAEIDGASIGKFFGQALLDQDTVLRLPRDHTIPVKTTADGRIPIMTSVLTESSPKHIDCHMAEERDFALLNEDHVGFVFLNTNPNAHFSHGDAVIPVQAGTLVTFPGSVEHHTVIHSGSVHLAGPFHLDSVDFVNMGAYDPRQPVPDSDDKDRQLKVDAVFRAQGNLRGLQTEHRVLLEETARDDE